MKRIMKKILFFGIFMLIISGIYAQPIQFDNIYNSYRGEDGVVALYIPGFICKLAGAIADVENDERELLRSIRSIRILAVEDSYLNREVNFAEDFNTKRLEKKYTTLLQVHEENEDVLILAREKNRSIQELVIVVGGEENALICIKGRMNKDLLHVLSDATGISECRHTREL